MSQEGEIRVTFEYGERGQVTFETKTWKVCSVFCSREKTVSGSETICGTISHSHADCEPRTWTLPTRAVATYLWDGKGW